MNHWQMVSLVGLGGAIGALLRYGASRFAAWRQSKAYYATLAVNLTGSLLIGVFVGMQLRDAHPMRYAFLGTGILGGLTTYSTLNTQKAAMVREGKFSLLASYLTATYLGSWAAFAIGWGIGKAIPHFT